ncbi:MAG: ABC transporter substrate-binding protein [Yaniella sp.]|nr:ABC transporter substrate-binding protein [Yaniella sp.]MDN6152211.1 ABC transporter substrate-binding protein [Yaniella sp.]
MKKNLVSRPHIRLVGAIALVGAVLGTTACNADEENDTQGGGVEASRQVVESIERDDSLAERLPDEYSSAMKIGMTFTFPPMRYMEGDTRVGAEYDLADAVTRKLGTEMDVKEVSFDGLIPALKAKRIDLAVESFADLPERRKEVSFIDYYRSATSLEVKKGNPLKIGGLDDMCGHSIALQQGVESVERAKTQNKQCEENGEKPIDIKLYESSNDATLAVVNGRADATGNDYPAALYEAKTVQDGEALEVVDTPISSDYFYGIGVRKDEDELQEVLRDTVQALMDSGDYANILKAYDLDKGIIDKSGINDGPAKE